MAAPYKPRKPGSLKEACAQLVQKCGGQKAVAAIWKCSAQNVARMTDDTCPQNPPRLDQVLALELQAKDPVVTRYMASMAGAIVEQVNCDHSQPLAFVMGSISKETGDVLCAAAMAVSEGRMTTTQAAMVLRETDDVMCAFAQLRAACRDVLEVAA